MILLELFLAFRFLKKRKSNFLFSKFTILSIISITLSISISLFVISIVNGFHHTIKDKILSYNADIRLKSYSQSDALIDWEDIIKKLKKKFQIKVIFPFFERKAIIIKKNGQIQKNPSFIVLSSYYKNRFEDNILFLKNFKIEKSNSKELSFSFNKDNEIILGETLADKNWIFLNDSIEIILPDKNFYKDILLENNKIFQVSKIYNANIALLNDNIAFIPFESIEKNLGIKGIPNGIALIFNDKNQKLKTIDFIKKNYQYLQIEDIDKSIIFQNLKKEKILSFFIILILTFFASTTMFISTSSFLLDKKNDFFILKVLGFNLKKLYRISMFLSSFISLIGILLGNLLGVLLVKYLELILLKLENGIQIIFKFFNLKANYQLRIIDKDIFYLEGIPYYFNIFDLILISTFSFIFCFITNHFLCLKILFKNKK